MVLGAIPALLLGIGEVLPAVLALLGVIIGGAIAAVTNVLVSKAGRRAQIVTAIWPERVRAHQEAFVLWWHVTGLIFKADELGKAIREAEDWWVKNCLYLSEEAYNAFKRMLSFANTHEILVKSYQETGSEARAQAAKENWKEIMALAQILAEGAGRHISDQVLKELSKEADTRAKTARIDL